MFNWDFLQPYGQQPTRLLCTWDFPGKNTSIGLPFPIPGELSDPGILSPAFTGRFYTTCTTREVLQDYVQFSSVQSLSPVWLFVTLWTTAHQASLSITNPQACPNSCPLSWWCYPINSASVIPFSSCLQSFSASGSFPGSFLHIRWPKDWSFSFSISPSNEYSGLISFRMDWLDLLAVQGTLKRLLQHHCSEASVLWCSAFFMVQLSHPYMTTGKIIAVTRQTFVGKAMSLLFNMLSRLVIAFLPRSKRL